MPINRCRRPLQRMPVVVPFLSPYWAKAFCKLAKLSRITER